MATNQTTKNKGDDKAQIKQLIDDFNKALTVKDVNRMMAHYASDVIVFDVKPPFQTKGAVAWRHTWEACMPFFPDTFQVEVKEMNIVAGTDVAFAHWLFRIVVEGQHDAAQTWIRTTGCYKKQQGRWKIIHEHGSLPFNPHTQQAVFTLDV